MRKLPGYFTPFELMIWTCSIALIITSFVLFDGNNFLTLVASLIGATSLIFNAKGNPIGQALMVIFSILYGFISLRFAYYGELITYVGMTMPMAILSLFAWLKNPFSAQKMEVKISNLSDKKLIGLLISTVAVTVAFYFVLGVLHTRNLTLSTLSVMTSYIAAYLTFARSPFFALTYVLNDVILIVLWSLASMVDRSNFSVIICFATFMVNDAYIFFNWCRMKKRQQHAKER